jgi:mRNA-degrading endonuclease RelE of RelBE toxin-antitoxin system
MTPPKPSKSKIPGIAPTSNKDPKKIAEQIKDGSMSTKTQKILLKWDQWSDEDIEKADREAEKYLYHIHNGPYRITSEPLTLQQIKERHGGVNRLESSGFRLIRYAPENKKEQSSK